MSSIKPTIDRLSELAKGEPEEWRIEREPHDYGDGTDHFIHVIYTAHDINGAEMTVLISSYLTEELAEMLVTLKNNLPELLRLAAVGVDVERGVPPRGRDDV